jgi:nitroreductase
MDIVEAVKTRKSIRAFKSDPVPQSVLREILEVARNSPSWANTQPWEFAVVAGSPLQEIKKGYVEKGDTQADMEAGRPPQFPEPYLNRVRALGQKEYGLLGVTRDNKEGRAWWSSQNFLNYGAPCVIYILIDRAYHNHEKGINVWPVYDCGLISQTIMLLATNYGLGTVVQAQAVIHPDIIRKVIGVPDSKLILIGIAIGYPDWAKKITTFRSDKEPLDSLVRWYGFSPK